MAKSPPVGISWARVAAAAGGLFLCAALVGQGMAAEAQRRIAIAPDPREAFPGGETTTSSVDTTNAFSNPSANMGFAKELDFKIGNGVFRKLWVSAPASTRSSDGLGPLYNARACQSCHLKDGRGHPPRTNDIADRSVSMFLRLSVPPRTTEEADAVAAGKLSVVPEPTYGTQLQELAVQGQPGEGRMQIDYTEIPIEMAGGETATLRKPVYRVIDLGYGPLDSRTLLSPRVTPQMIGLGLLEAIPEADIRALADPEDRDGDGISGRPNEVWSVEAGRLALGRFGWKAGQPTILQQTAEAFAGDIGIGSWLSPRAAGDCTSAQTQCLGAPHGAGARGEEEISRKLLDLVAFYARNLAVPARRGLDNPAVAAGRVTFHAIGCATCHVPSHRTGSDSPDVHLRNQVIWPYTDLLLHDMGEGLADGRPEGRADGREWRTAPLWGIGLTGLVNGHTFFLHDGRARNLTEAILWHDGEARTAKEAFRALSPKERADLLAFVNSL